MGTVHAHDSCSMFKGIDLSLFDEEVAKTTHASSARCSIQLLQQYLIEQGIIDAYMYHTAIDMYTGKVFRRANVKMRQMTLDLFMLHL